MAQSPLKQGRKLIVEILKGLDTKMIALMIQLCSKLFTLRRGLPVRSLAFSAANKSSRHKNYTQTKAWVMTPNQAQFGFSHLEQVLAPLRVLAPPHLLSFMNWISQDMYRLPNKASMIFDKKVEKFVLVIPSLPDLGKNSTNIFNYQSKGALAQKID